MHRRPFSTIPLAVILLATAGCGPGVNLQEALTVTDVITGYYDNGFKDGKQHFVPSISFRLRNQADQNVASLQLTYDFWKAGEDGPFDSGLIRAVDSSGIEPGATSNPITLRGSVGYTLEVLPADFFTHSLFKDATVKIFAKRSGQIAALGEFKIERRLLPHSPSGRP
jgi:hypothetical protein